MRGNLFNIVRNFILFYLWAQRCQFCIQGIYMLQQKKFLSKLQPPWWRRGIVSWHVVNKHKLFREASKHVKIEGSFKSAWCHLGIFGNGESTINWCFHPQFVLPRFYWLRKRVLSPFGIFLQHIWLSSLLCYLFEKKWTRRERSTWSSFQTTLNTLSSLKQTLSTFLGVYLFLELERVRVGYMYTFRYQVWKTKEHILTLD